MDLTIRLSVVCCFALLLWSLNFGIISTTTQVHPSHNRQLITQQLRLLLIQLRGHRPNENRSRYLTAEAVSRLPAPVIRRILGRSSDTFGHYVKFLMNNRNAAKERNTASSTGNLKLLPSSPEANQARMQLQRRIMFDPQHKKRIAKAMEKLAQHRDRRLKISNKLAQYRNGRLAQYGNGRLAQHGNGKLAQHGNGRLAQHGNAILAQHGDGKLAQHRDRTLKFSNKLVQYRDGRLMLLNKRKHGRWINNRRKHYKIITITV